MVWITPFKSETSVPGRKFIESSEYLSSAWPLGSKIKSLEPFLAAFFIKVDATGWLTEGFAPITQITSAFFASEKGAVTAPDPIFSNKAATDDAWQSLVQWSTLLVLNAVLISFWKR